MFHDPVIIKVKCFKDGLELTLRNSIHSPTSLIPSKKLVKQIQY